MDDTLLVFGLSYWHDVWNFIVIAIAVIACILAAANVLSWLSNLGGKPADQLLKEFDEEWKRTRK